MINKYRICLDMEDARGYKWCNGEVTLWCSSKNQADNIAKRYREYVNTRSEYNGEKVVGYRVHLEY